MLLSSLIKFVIYLVCVCVFFFFTFIAQQSRVTFYLNFQVLCATYFVYRMICMSSVFMPLKSTQTIS